MKQEILDYYESAGCIACSIGTKKMPKGYTLMNSVEGYFFWVREDGIESTIDWTWQNVYESAKQNEILFRRMNEESNT